MSDALFFTSIIVKKKKIGVQCFLTKSKVELPINSSEQYKLGFM